MLPLRRWTNRLAWAVWSIRKKNKQRSKTEKVPTDNPSADSTLVTADSTQFTADGT